MSSAGESRPIHVVVADNTEEGTIVKYKEPVVPFLIEELGRTKSDNTTRQWIQEILQFLERCPLQVIKEPLEQMLADGRFSLRLKRRVLNLISDSRSAI